MPELNVCIFDLDSANLFEKAILDVAVRAAEEQQTIPVADRQPLASNILISQNQADKKTELKNMVLEHLSSTDMKA